MKKKTLVLLLLSLFLLGSNLHKNNIFAQETLPGEGGPEPSCYEHRSVCSIINPGPGSWCAHGGSGSPCFNTECDCT